MLFVSCFLCIGNYAFAGKTTSSTFAEQKDACSGVVKDATGETVIGASVVVKSNGGGLTVQ